MKKTFVLTQFGTPHEWTQEFIDHVQHLEQYGWYWKIFTPNSLESKGNVEIVLMNADHFNDLVEVKTGVRPNFFMTQKGIPSVHITDYYVATGKIFEDWLKDSDFWGITNIDVVYGRLDRFLPDSFLSDCDIFTDDVGGVINGVFSLYRNSETVNNLFTEIPDWEGKFAQKPCLACKGESNKHTLYGTDEYFMTDVVKKASDEQRIRLKYLQHTPFHSHDRLEQHVPDVKLSITPEGSLFEFFKDTEPPNWIHARPFIGREIPYFHFIRTKEWPKSLKFGLGTGPTGMSTGPR